MRSATVDGNRVRMLARLVGAACLLGMLPATAVKAQSGAVMYLAGIPGSSNAQPFLGWIDVDGYATAAIREFNSVQVPGESGEPTFQPVEVRKLVDSSDAALLQRLVQGTSIPSGCLLTYFIDSQTGVARPRSAIGLGPTQVVALSPVTPPGGLPQQSVSLAYSEIAVINYQYSGAGTPSGIESFCWNVQTNSACSSGQLFSCPGL